MRRLDSLPELVILCLEVLFSYAEGGLHALHVRAEFCQGSIDFTEQGAGRAALDADGLELGVDEAEGFFVGGVCVHGGFRYIRLERFRW
jgi:hypothetical protein